MALNRFHVVSPLGLVAFSACRSPYLGEGGAVGGAVINGPLNQALVFLDYDFDGVLDANEPSARTDQFGKYTLTSTQSNYDLIAIADDQTMDTSSGATFSGITLKAPSGSGVISPTSTLMKEGGLTATEVAAVLGLPDGVDPLTFNPFDVDANDPVAVANALEVAKVSKQITTALSSFASAAEGAGAGADGAFSAALKSVVDVVKTKASKAKDPNASETDKKIDFTKTDDLELIKAQVTMKAAALDGIDMTTMNAMANDTRDAIKNVNDKIATVADLNSDATKNIFSTTQVLRDQVKEAAVAKKAGEVANIAFKSRTEVDNQATNKAPQDINLTGGGTISESASSLVVGVITTVDTDQAYGSAFKYQLAGKDAALFSLNETTGELSLKAKPNYASKPSYEVTIITKDAGGKKYAETFQINVVKEATGGVLSDSGSHSDSDELSDSGSHSDSDELSDSGSHSDSDELSDSGVKPDNSSDTDGNSNIKIEPAPIPPLAPLNTTTHKITVDNGKFLIDGNSHKTFELIEGKTYRFDLSDVSNKTHSFKFSTEADGTEFTSKVVTFGTPGSKDAFAQVTTSYKLPDLHIFCENHIGMGLTLTTKTPFAGTLVADSGKDYEVKLHYVKMFELEKGSYFGELEYDKELYPNAQFTMNSESDPFRIDGTSIYLKTDNHYYKAEDSGPYIYETKIGSTGVATFPDGIWIKVTDGPMHSWFAQNGGVGTSRFDNLGFTNKDNFYPAGENPVVTLVDFTDSAFEMGAKIGTINYGFSNQYVGLTNQGGTKLDKFFEFNGDILKLKDNYAYDPVDQTIKTTTGKADDMFYTQGNWLNEIQFVGYETAADLADKSTTSTFLAGVDVTSLFTNVDPAPLTYYGNPSASSKSLSGNNKIDALLPEATSESQNPASYFLTDPYYSKTLASNLIGDDTVITYSFVPSGLDNQYFLDTAKAADHRPQFGTDNIYEMSDAHKAAVRTVLSEFSKVADIYFHEVTDTETEVGTMRFMWTDHLWEIGDNHAAGWASSPGGGDVWLYNKSGVPSDDFIQLGKNTGAATLLHEVGHALGLNHPFEGNRFTDNKFDNQAYTVMSYSQYDEVWAHINGESIFTISSTPSLLDITALQYLYGSQESTNLGDTTYKFEEDMPFAKAIWDAGGNDDLLDFSNFTTDLKVSLIPGTSSTISTTIPKGTWKMADNLGIADNALIENIIAGSGNDTIVGNDTANLIMGGAGNDTLTGGQGADVYDFAAGFGNDVIKDFVKGTDKLKFTDALGNVVAELNGSNLVGAKQGQDFLITMGTDELILEGLGETTFDNTFLEIV